MTPQAVLTWMRRRGNCHAGMWVALADHEVVAEHADRACLVTALEASGDLERCILVPVPGARR